MSKRVTITVTERRIIDTLQKLVPAAAASYEQCLFDLADPSRKSHRGTAHELREALRETLDYLAPDGAVLAESDFKLDANTTRPTQRQKALHVLKKRGLSKEAMRAPELAVQMIEGGAGIARAAYTAGSKSAHSVGTGGEVRQLKLYIDATLGELLEIYADDANAA